MIPPKTPAARTPAAPSIPLISTFDPPLGEVLAEAASLTLDPVGVAEPVTEDEEEVILAGPVAEEEEPEIDALELEVAIELEFPLMLILLLPLMLMLILEFPLGLALGTAARLADPPPIEE
jgi:hypothetical protein